MAEKATVSGTSARKRPEFLRMIRQCKQKKIDLILTKSISRFARSTGSPSSSRSRTSTRWKATVRCSSPCWGPSPRRRANPSPPMSAGASAKPCGRARRKTAKSPTKAASTGLTSYASKYALSERLVCGECGTLYRRCTWRKNGKTRIVWRCVSRLDYGKRYCHNSPTLDEEPLQRAILAAVNKAMGQKDALIWKVIRAMEKDISPIPGEEMSLADIEKRLAEIDQEVGQLLPKAVSEGENACRDQLKDLLEETITLKGKRAYLQEQREKDSAAARLSFPLPYQKIGLQARKGEAI